MSVATEMAPRPLEALTTAEMNAGSSAGPSKAAVAHHTNSSTVQSSQSGKRKAQDGSDVVSDEDEEFEGVERAVTQKGASKKTRLDKQSSASPSKRREGSTTSVDETVQESNTSPEKAASELAKEEKRKHREAKKAEKAKKEAEKEAKRQKEAQMRKRAANFMSSFVQQRSSNVASPQKVGNPLAQVSDYQRCFPPCKYKDTAPINRHHRGLDVTKFDEALQTASEGVTDLLRQFTGSRLQPNISLAKSCKRPSRKGIRAPISVRDSMRLVTEAGVLGDDRLEENGRRGLNNLADRKRVPMKLLHFESDRRPAWYGTWTRSSNLVGPRRPLGQDPVALDYTYDSDAEWEDVDPLDGDDVQDNDDRDEEDRCSRSDSDSEMGDWLVDDLEVEEDDEMDGDHPALHLESRGPFDASTAPSTVSSTLNAHTSELKEKRKKKIKPIGRRFETKLIKFETGPHWEAVLGIPTYEGFRGYQMEMLNDALPGLDPFTFTSSNVEQLAIKGDESTAGVQRDDKAETQMAAQHDSDSKLVGRLSHSVTSPNSAVLAKAKSFPDENLSQLLQAIEGKATIRPILVEELRATFASWGKTGVPKTTLEACLTIYAEKQSKKAGGKWVVRQEYRPMAGLD